MTKPLSPAALAVMRAAAASYWDPEEDYEVASPAAIAAAALRAAADQVVPETTTPWNSTLTPMISAGEVRAKFLAIAAELENRND
jgi:hypothetical protein